MNLDKTVKSWRRLADNPFNSQRKMMSVLVINGDNSKELGGAPFYSFVKGAPNIVLDRCERIMSADGQVRPLPVEQKNDIMNGEFLCLW